MEAAQPVHRPKRLYRRAKSQVVCLRCGRKRWVKPPPWLQRMLINATAVESHRVAMWVECGPIPEGCGHDLPVTVGDVRRAQ